MRVGKANNQTSATITKAKEKVLLKRGKRTKRDIKKEGKRAGQKRERGHIHLI